MTLIGERVVVAVPVRRGLAGQGGPADGRGITVRTLPAVPEMACLLHRGGYTGLSASWQALLAWVHDTGAEPGRDLREVYLSFSAEEDLALRPDYLADHPGDFITELQVPIAR